MKADWIGIWGEEVEFREDKLSAEFGQSMMWYMRFWSISNCWPIPHSIPFGVSLRMSNKFHLVDLESVNIYPASSSLILSRSSDGWRFCDELANLDGDRSEFLESIISELFEGRLQYIKPTCKFLTTHRMLIGTSWMHWCACTFVQIVDKSDINISHKFPISPCSLRKSYSYSFARIAEENDVAVELLAETLCARVLRMDATDCMNYVVRMNLIRKVSQLESRTVSQKHMWSYLR
jgi:hypothetical protein